MDAVARKDLRAIFELNPKDIHVDVADDQYFATDTLRMWHGKFCLGMYACFLHH
jgi:pentose-5-phosphate-3-epimerase